MGTLLSWEQYNDPLSLSCPGVCSSALALLIGLCPGGDPETIDRSGLENEMKCPQRSSLVVIGYIHRKGIYVVTSWSFTVFSPLQDSSHLQRLASESTVVRLEQKILTIKAEQEAVLSSMGEEVDVACCSLLKNGQSNLKVFIYHLLCIASWCCMSFCIIYVRYAKWSIGFFSKIPTNAHVWISVPLLILANESSQILSAYRFPNPSEQCCSPTHKETLHLICNLSCWKGARLASDWPNEGNH